MTVMMSDTDYNVYLIPLFHVIMSIILSAQTTIVYEIIKEPMTLT